VNILVTGASGFVGRQLVAALIERRPKDCISVLLLPEERIPQAFIGKVLIERGDLRDPGSIRKAIRGKDLVFHLAGYISYWVLDAGMLKAVNVDGVRTVVESCIEFGIKRLIHVSSVGAIGFDPQGVLADEAKPFNWPDSFRYMTTKRDGQRIVEQAVRERGLDAVIVNPASIMGPGDPLPDSAHNRLYSTMFKLPFFVGTFGGGLAIVDVRDLTETILAAADRGRSGESYLSVGANVPYKTVLSLMAHHAGKKFLPIVIPSFVLVFAGWFAELISRLTRRRPLLTLAYGRLSGWTAYYSNKKSIDELGISYRTLEQTIGDGCAYYTSISLNSDKESARSQP
jgi:dihydroflavonol-4-reductase